MWKFSRVLYAILLIGAANPLWSRARYSIQAPENCQTCHTSPAASDAGNESGWSQAPPDKTTWTYSCQSCHWNGSSGGSLTPAGRYFQDNVLPALGARHRPTADRKRTFSDRWEAWFGSKTGLTPEYDPGQDKEIQQEADDLFESHLGLPPDSRKQLARFLILVAQQGPSLSEEEYKDLEKNTDEPPSLPPTLRGENTGPARHRPFFYSGDWLAWSSPLGYPAREQTIDAERFSHINGAPLSQSRVTAGFWYLSGNSPFNDKDSAWLSRMSVENRLRPLWGAWPVLETGASLINNSQTYRAYEGQPRVTRQNTNHDFRVERLSLALDRDGSRLAGQIGLFTPTQSPANPGPASLLYRIGQTGVWSAHNPASPGIRAQGHFYPLAWSAAVFMPESVSGGYSGWGTALSLRRDVASWGTGLSLEIRAPMRDEATSWRSGWDIQARPRWSFIKNRSLVLQNSLGFGRGLVASTSGATGEGSGYFYWHSAVIYRWLAGLEWELVQESLWLRGNKSPDSLTRFGPGLALHPWPRWRLSAQFLRDLFWQRPGAGHFLFLVGLKARY